MELTDDSSHLDGSSSSSPMALCVVVLWWFYDVESLNPIDRRAGILSPQKEGRVVIKIRDWNQSTHMTKTSHQIEAKNSRNLETSDFCS